MRALSKNGDAVRFSDFYFDNENGDRPMTRITRLSSVATTILIAFAACAPLAGRAASDSTDPGTHVYTLGTQGGPFPSVQRAEPSNALVVNGAIYLIDAGNGVARQLVIAGLDFRKVNQIFITHNHDDHNADWGTLMGLQWSVGRRTPVEVHGPIGTESMLGGFLQYFAPNVQVRSADTNMPVPPSQVFRAKDILGPGVIYQDANVKVTAAENCHFHFNPKSAGDNPEKSYAFRFETKDKVVVFSGDTGACGDAIVKISKDADILVHEVASLPLVEAALRAYMPSQASSAAEAQFQGLMRHMEADHSTPEEVGRVAAAAGVKRVVLTHFVPGRDNESDSAYVDGVRKFFKGPVTAAHDGMEF